MKVEYWEAVSGFDQHGGRSVPVYDGIITFERNWLPLLQEYVKREIKLKSEKAKNEEKEIRGLWDGLFWKMIAWKYVNKLYDVQGTSDQFALLEEEIRKIK